MEITGYGYGYGYGSGDGSGSGYGYPDGYGYGDRDGYFNALLAPHQKSGARTAFWRSHLDGTPANGGNTTRAKVGLLQRVDGPLRLCSSNALHASLNPGKWKGDRWWVVRLIGEIADDGEDKLGALEREIVADLGLCPF